MNYAEKTKWCITWSKLKVFNHDPLLYKLMYVDMVEIEEKQEKRYFVTWTAFHHIMEYWTESFLESYYIDEWLVKSKIIEELKSLLTRKYSDSEIDKFSEILKWIVVYTDVVKQRIQEKADSLKTEKSKQKYVDLLENLNELEMVNWLELPELRNVYYKNTTDTKIELTPAEWRDCLGMYEEALKQPMRDLGGEYIKEYRFECMYKNLKLTAQLDRIWIEDKNGKRYKIDEIDSLLLRKHKEEQKKVITELWLTSIIRDFKTSWDLGRLHKELIYWDESKDYILSMSFYYTIIYVLYGLESTVYLDVIEKSSPYVTDTITLLPWILENSLREKIKPLLERIIKCEESGEYEHRSRDQRVMDNKAKHYIKYHPEYLQKSPTIIELDYV